MSVRVRWVRCRTHFFACSAAVADRRIVETVVPQRTLDDVILPPATRRSLEQALVHVTRHDLIFNRWGFRERHPTSLALAFNFAGPPGTGKTICAEAIAHALGARLLIVRYAQVESMWMGETAKNVAAAFRLARKENAGTAVRRGGCDRVAALIVAGSGVRARVQHRRSTCCCRSSNASTAWSSSRPIWRRTSIRRSSGGFARTSCSRCRASPSASRSGACRCTRR